MVENKKGKGEEGETEGGIKTIVERDENCDRRAS